MAAQAPKAPVSRNAREPKRGVKNPFIYAGTIVVLVIVVIAFVFVPMGGGASMGGGTNLSFGQYAGQGIFYGQGTFMAQQVQYLDAAMRQQGLTQDNYQLYAYQVYRGAFERTVIHMAILDAVKKSGGRVTDAWLDSQVASLPQFQENGVFSAKLYQDAGLSKQMAVRKDLREGTLYNAYFSDVLGLKASSKETAFVKDMARDQRSIRYVAYPLSAYPDSEVRAWGEANASLFRSITLSRVTITSSESDALKLLKNIKSGATTFEEVAKASSKDANAQDGGSMGAKYFHEISAELAVKADADSIETLQPGEISPVIKTSAGAWAFYRADASPVDADFSKPEVLASVREYMTRSERGTIEDWLVAKASEISAAGGSGFEAAAKKAGLAVKTTEPFPINYGDFSVYLSQYGQSIPLFRSVESDETPELYGASTSDQFLTAVFSLKSGEVSDPIVLGDNTIVIEIAETIRAEDDDLAGVELFYPEYYGGELSTQVRQLFMDSPKLKDNFSEIFFKYFYASSDSSKES